MAPGAEAARSYPYLQDWNSRGRGLEVGKLVLRIQLKAGSVINTPLLKRHNAASAS